MENNKIELMEKTPVKKAVLQLAIPTMLAMAVQMIYNLTDTYFIGQTGDLNLVAALSLATPIFMLIQAIGNIFANGTSSYISRNLGAKNYTEAKHANSVAVYTAIMIGITLTIVLLTFKTPILNVIGTSEATFIPTSQYLTIVTVFSIILILNVTLAGLVRAEGATKKAMIGMVIGIVLNIGLDPIFILVLDLGVVGAAWATVIGNFAGTLFFIIHFLSKNTLLSIRLKDFKPNVKMYKETFKIGIPAALSNVVMSISFVLVNVIAVSYGDHVVAGNGVQMRVASMSVMLVMGLALGFQPFAGYNYGAKKFDRLKSGFKITMIYGTVLSITFAIIFYFFGEELIRLFINDDATVKAGSKILRAFVWSIPCFGVQFTMMVTFQATGKAVKAMIVSLGRQCIIYIPLLFALNTLYGFDGFIYAQPAADVLTTIIALLLSVSFIKNMDALHENEIKIT
jgi:putative MATE family efflux protein